MAVFEIQPLQWEQLNTLVKERVGLQIDSNRLPGLLQALSQDQTPDFDSLIQTLTVSSLDSQVWQNVLNAITIGETYFFRNKPHLDVLQHHILPPLIQQRRAAGQKFLRIWSAGCSTGEEAYSIAMLLREMIPDINEWLITILATDINEASLEAAQRGLYTSNSFRNETRPDIKNQWFTPNGTRVELHAAVRRMVNFRLLNLISDDYPSYTTNTMNMDVIFCRNVTIYFDKQETIQVINRLHRALNHGGWLVVGHSEPQPAVYDAFQMVTLDNAIFYRKREMDVPAHTIQAATPVPAPLAPVKPAKPVSAAIPVCVPVDRVEEALTYTKQAADAARWDEALTLLTRYENELRLNPYAHYLRAVIYLHSSYLESAIAALRQALYCDPRCILAQSLMGDCYAQRKQMIDAQRHWRLALEATTGLDASATIPYEADVTVDMMRQLLNYRLKEAAHALS